MSDSSDSESSSDLSDSPAFEQLVAILKSADYLKEFFTDTDPKFLSLLTNDEAVKDFVTYVLAYSPKQDDFRPSKIPTGNDLVRLIVLFPIISLMYGWILGSKSVPKNSE